MSLGKGTGGWSRRMVIPIAERGHLMEIQQRILTSLRRLLTCLADILRVLE
jgi:hypothetical protein